MWISLLGVLIREGAPDVDAPDHRRAANRCGLRYPSDLTDEEWVIVRADDVQPWRDAVDANAR